jgi:RNA polymerase sigma-70 factor (ECF subfamily)
MPAMSESHNADHLGDPESSLGLLKRAQAGDEDALNRLVARYLPRLRRWATGRLPASARGMTDTHDLVQDTVSQAFKKIGGFEIRGEGALQAYLRQALLNQIRQEIRKASRRPHRADGDLHDVARGIPHPGPSPLEEAIGVQAVERYETALGRLRPDDQEAIVARIELGLSHTEVAEALGKPSANAARMAVERALARLLEEMSRADRGAPERTA